MLSVNHYEILGVSQLSTKEEIAAAYKRLAMRWHPDRHQDATKAQAEIKFKQISASYTILSDENQRACFDHTLKYGSDERHATQNHQYDYHHEYNRHRERAKPGANVKKSVTISVEAAISGGHVEVSFTDKLWCKSCEGCGGTQKTCSKCKGSGYVRFRICPQCDGYGQDLENCPDCNGDGKVTKTFTIKVNLPKGLVDGSVLIVKERGKESRYGGLNGNLTLTIKIRQSVLWKYKGANIHGLVKIPYPLAVLGGFCSVNLPTGKQVNISIPPNTNYNVKFRLPGEGLYDAKEKTVGDVILVATLVLPSTKRKLSTQEEDTLRAIMA